MIIGICGPSGSGKSYYSKKFKQKLESRYTSVIVIHMDNFFKGISQYDKFQKEAHEKGELSYDEPDIIDIDYLLEFLKSLKSLKKGESVKMPIYDFSLFDRLNKDKWIKIEESYDIIIIEGLFAFYFESLRNMFDYKIYMGTPEPICFERRINRNIKSRLGPSGIPNKEFEIKYYKKYVYPSYKKYIEPLKLYADIIF
jgi:uridine kinase